MANWQRFTPTDFEYDFERDELAAHHVTFDQAVECFFSDLGAPQQILQRSLPTDRQNHWRPQAQDYLSTQAWGGRSYHYRMGCMNTRGKKNGQILSEAEIDKIIVAQTDDDSAWEKPVKVKRRKATSVSIPAELAGRAAFLARLHREEMIEEWLTRIIRERVELEEAAFAGAKRELLSRHGG